ncbi:GNAT family N-acetyltransferase [Rhizobium sp. TRM95111]|uniref:GNAT family N-acetyltransferase n=1 Tax=Rhizobium alarense TaxID=2846851 RepID=UPI001F2B2923|nr:GNAT family N-acetyltransferase [Rhizobium alarense]MCF3643173.1 GNAT family N-acetyltransferase [Rhizobium alarense]
MNLLVTYMEMLARPSGHPLAPPSDGVTVQREPLSADGYLDLYRGIGAPLQWDRRLRMPREDLVRFVAAPSTSLFVLRENGQPVGLCEFDHTDEDNVELVHFGLIPQVQGRRLGPHLLDTALRVVWTERTRRVWLHTDTNDHEKARATYERAGFRVYLQQFEDFPD